MKKVSVVVIGFGDRAVAYTKYALNNPDRLEVVAAIDPNPFRRNLAKEMFGLKDEMLFSDMEDCLKLGKIADAVINGTMDELHIKTAIPFLKLGYDMLLEKPITNNKKDLLELKRVGDEHGCKLMICHVLRYTPFYLKIKEIILSGEIGDIVGMETNEMVGVAHASASYIRGKWNNRKKCGSSMLLAKCCHDADLLCWFNAGKKPVKVSSFGGRHYFIEKNAPKGSGKRCLVDCEVENECPYSCKKLLIDNEYFAQYTFTSLNKNYEDITTEEKIQSLKTDNPMGRCIYKTDADIVDRQAFIVEFDDGSIATHSMISGVARPGRNIHIIGTKGEIQGFLEDNKFVVRTYNPSNCLWNEREEVITNVVKGDGHSGGDSRLVNDFVNMESGLPRSVSATVIEDSINGHLLVFAADESLDNGGITVKINDK
ncbi:MAG: Gfo/Idh/MocA family oxidoreductase [Clostridia bacterium]|nr:Gfo/Idh/MocA family oxidoreductase [Clostridia bacterium]